MNSCENYNNIDNIVNNIDNIDIDDDNNNESNIINIDAWNEAINDNEFIIKNKISRIFPQLKNSNNYLKLMIDEDSFSFITIREIAELTSKIICYHLIKYNINPQKIKIIDYTAGVGGNAISFGKYFYYTYAIEIDKTRAEYLSNNINVYNLKNIKIINDSSINFNKYNMIEINPNVIFIDPPWGGNCYRNNDLLKLTLGDIPIEELIIDIFDKYYTIITDAINSYSNRLVVLKLPKNYDIEYIYNYIKKNTDTKPYIICSYLYILNKMLILVCEYKII
jgi:predicted RNA methylase